MDPTDVGRGGGNGGEGKKGKGREREREGEGKGAPHFLLTTLTTDLALNVLFLNQIVFTFTLERNI